MRLLGRTEPTRVIRTIYDNLAALREENAALREENTALRKENAALRTVSTEARTDELTGLYNRRWLRQYWNELPAPGLVISAVIQIDIDRFKSINDRYGHKIGDHAIVHIAYALRRICATVVRTGGDEFVLLVPRDQSPEDVAGSVLAEARRPMPVPSGLLTTTISVGICQLDPVSEPLDLSDAIERADQAMYVAKQRKGDQVVVA